MKSYVVEMEGYNDGHPYTASRHNTLGEASRSLTDHRKSNPLVRYRLIHEIEEFST